MSVDITVRGSCTAHRPPERAVVRLSVGLEGARAEDVNAGASRQAREVADTLRALHDPEAGPVTRWSSSQLRSWADRPWNDQGKRLPLVHHATVDVRATFSDVAVLGRWLGEVMDVEGVSVQGIEWALTEEHRQELLEEVRTGAVADAEQRAAAYARALGLQDVRPLALADAGMLGEGLSPQVVAEAAMYSRAAGATTVELTPADVSVTVEVDARFVAG